MLQTDDEVHSQHPHCISAPYHVTDRTISRHSANERTWTIRVDLFAIFRWDQLIN